MLEILTEHLFLSTELNNKDNFILRSYGVFHRSGFGKVLGDKEVSQRLVTPLRPKPLDQLVDFEEPECLDIDINIDISTSIANLYRL